MKEAKRNLCEFVAVVKKLSKSEYGRFEEHIGLADSIFQCLKTQGIEDKDGEKLRLAGCFQSVYFSHKNHSPILQQESNDRMW